MYGTPEHHILKGSEAAISYYEWGPADGRPVLFLHATGFHARVWDKTIAQLGEGFRSIAVDLRGHGLSGNTGPVTSWSPVADDVAELIAKLKLKGVIGVGHSMGGHTVTSVAARLPDVFTHLLLVDPVIGPPERYENNPYASYKSPKEHPVGRRRNVWANWQELYHRLENQHPYSLWEKDILEDYCRFGLHPRPGGEMELACPPEIEASFYMTFVENNIHPLIPTITQPVRVMRAKPPDPSGKGVMDFAVSPTWEKLADAFPNGTDIYLPQLSHFIPMQDPALVARTINEMARENVDREGAAHE